MKLVHWGLRIELQFCFVFGRPGVLLDYQVTLNSKMELDYTLSYSIGDM